MNISKINPNSIRSYKDRILVLWKCDITLESSCQDLIDNENIKIDSHRVDENGELTLISQAPMLNYFVENSEKAIMGVFATKELAELYKEKSAFGYYKDCEITSTSKNFTHWYKNSIKTRPENINGLWIGDELKIEEINLAS